MMRSVILINRLRIAILLHRHLANLLFLLSLQPYFTNMQTSFLQQPAMQE